MSYKLKGPIGRSKAHTQERNRITENAINSKAKPMDLEALKDLQFEGQLSLEVFKENISKIFPLILERTSLGESIPSIARLIGLKAYVLHRFISRYPRIHRAVKSARDIKRDKKILEDSEMEFILS